MRLTIAVAAMVVAAAHLGAQSTDPIDRAVAAGADGILVEVHPNPDRALSDGGQSLYPDQFARLVAELRAISTAIGRDLAPPPALPRQSARGTVSAGAV